MTREKSLRCLLLLTVGAVFSTFFSLAAEDRPGVLCLDSERLSVLAGGNLEYPCVAEVILRTIPADAGGTVNLSLAGVET